MRRKVGKPESEQPRCGLAAKRPTRRGTPKSVSHIDNTTKTTKKVRDDANDKSNSGNNYHKLSKSYLKKKNVSANFDKNVSLKLFIESLDAMNAGY